MWQNISFFKVSHFFFSLSVRCLPLLLLWHGWLLPILRSQIISLPSLTILSVVLLWHFFFFLPLPWIFSHHGCIWFATIWFASQYLSQSLSISFLSSFPHLNVSFLRIRSLFVLFNLLCLIDCKCSANNRYINKWGCERVLLTSTIFNFTNYCSFYFLNISKGSRTNNFSPFFFLIFLPPSAPGTCPPCDVCPPCSGDVSSMPFLCPDVPPPPPELGPAVNIFFLPVPGCELQVGGRPESPGLCTWQFSHTCFLSKWINE